MITLTDVKKNPQILEFINQTEEAMTALSYTNHGLRHTNIVADRATQIAKSIGLTQREEELAVIMQAIANHDKEEMSFTNTISAIVVLADKSDVDRSRVTEKDLEKIKIDIHDRVNYATRESSLKVDKTKKRITLTLKIDTNFCPIIEYFEIFTERMVFCRKAAQFLGYNFGLI